jgi:hypothetical protein
MKTGDGYAKGEIEDGNRNAYKGDLLDAKTGATAG